MCYPVVRFEIAARSTDPVKRFYRELFGWSVQDVNVVGYGFIKTGSAEGIPGGIREADDGVARVLIYVRVPDLDSIVERALRLGSRIVLERTEVPGVATFAQIADPEGNIVGLIQ